MHGTVLRRQMPLDGIASLGLMGERIAGDAMAALAETTQWCAANVTVVVVNGRIKPVGLTPEGDLVLALIRAASRLR